MRQINKLLTFWPMGDSIGTQFKISKRLLPPPPGMVKIRTIMGFDIIVDAKNRSGFIDADLYNLGSYEPGVLHAIRSICGDESIVIDVGANIGAITLYMAEIAKRGRVLAFEPLPEIIKDLEANIQLNAYKNVEIHPYALGAKESKAQIYPDVTERGSSSLIDRKTPGHKYKDPVNVKVKKLDDFTQDLQRVDLIKIDVESYEAEVLKGALKTIEQHKPCLILEYDPKSMMKPELDRLLHSLPYDLYVPSKGKHYWSSRKPLESLAELPDNKLSTLVMLATDKANW
jgi:FkbM family methyltransferase